MEVLFKAKTAFVSSILVLFLALGTAFGSVPVTVSVTSGFDKSPVAIKDTAKATVKASATAPMNDESHIYDKASLWKWTWEIVSAPTNSTPYVTQDTSDPTQAYVSASFSESGDYTITVKASVWIGCSGGPAETGSGTKDLSDTAVKVKTIQFSVGGGSYQDVPSTFYVLQGQSVTFKALPSPDSASWPSGYPTWGGGAGASGTGSTKAVTFSTLSTTTTAPLPPLITKR